MQNYQMERPRMAVADSTYIRQVYVWMTIGLAVTGAVAMFIAGRPEIIAKIFGNTFILIGLFIAQIGLVMALSAAVQKMSAGVATGIFILYSAITGTTLSVIFITYTAASISNAFFVSAGTFMIMSIYGTVTKRDLTSMGSFLTMGLFGLIIAMVVNLFLKNSMMELIISCIGVLIFTGLTAYDTQKLRNIGETIDIDDSTALRRAVILGALTLYLDFINLFLMFLRLFGSRRD